MPLIVNLSRKKLFDVFFTMWGTVGRQKHWMIQCMTTCDLSDTTSRYGQTAELKMPLTNWWSLWARRREKTQATKVRRVTELTTITEVTWLLLPWRWRSLVGCPACPNVSQQSLFWKSIIIALFSHHHSPHLKNAGTFQCVTEMYLTAEKHRTQTAEEIQKYDKTLSTDLWLWSQADPASGFVVICGYKVVKIGCTFVWYINLCKHSMTAFWHVVHLNIKRHWSCSHPLISCSTFLCQKLD